MFDSAAHGDIHLRQDSSVEPRAYRPDRWPPSVTLTAAPAAPGTAAPAATATTSSSSPTSPTSPTASSSSSASMSHPHREHSHHHDRDRENERDEEDAGDEQPHDTPQRLVDSKHDPFFNTQPQPPFPSHQSLPLNVSQSYSASRRFPRSLTAPITRSLSSLSPANDLIDISHPPHPQKRASIAYPDHTPQNPLALHHNQPHAPLHAHYISLSKSGNNPKQEPVMLSQGLPPSLRDILPHPKAVRPRPLPTHSDLSAASTRAELEPTALRDLRRVTAPTALLDPAHYEYAEESTDNSNSLLPPLSSSFARVHVQRVSSSTTLNCQSVSNQQYFQRFHRDDDPRKNLPLTSSVQPFQALAGSVQKPPPPVISDPLASANHSQARDNHHISVIENAHPFLRTGSTGGRDSMLAAGLDEPKRRFRQSASGSNLSPSSGGRDRALTSSTGGGAVVSKQVSGSASAGFSLSLSGDRRRMSEGVLRRDRWSLLSDARRSRGWSPPAKHNRNHGSAGSTTSSTGVRASKLSAVAWSLRNLLPWNNGNRESSQPRDAQHHHQNQQQHQQPLQPHQHNRHQQHQWERDRDWNRGKHSRAKHVSPDSSLMLHQPIAIPDRLRDIDSQPNTMDITTGEPNPTLTSKAPRKNPDRDDNPLMNHAHPPVFRNERHPPDDPLPVALRRASLDESISLERERARERERVWGSEWNNATGNSGFNQHNVNRMNSGNIRSLTQSAPAPAPLVDIDVVEEWTLMQKLRERKQRQTAVPLPLPPPSPPLGARRMSSIGSSSPSEVSSTPPPRNQGSELASSAPSVPSAVSAPSAKSASSAPSATSAPSPPPSDVKPVTQMTDDRGQVVMMDHVDDRDSTQGDGDDRQGQPQVEADRQDEAITNPTSKRMLSFGRLKDLGVDISNAKETDDALDEEEAELERQEREKDGKLSDATGGIGLKKTSNYQSYSAAEQTAAENSVHQRQETDDGASDLLPDAPSPPLSPSPLVDMPSPPVMAFPASPSFDNPPADIPTAVIAMAASSTAPAQRSAPTDMDMGMDEDMDMGMSTPGGTRLDDTLESPLSATFDDGVRVDNAQLKKMVASDVGMQKTMVVGGVVVVQDTLKHERMRIRNADAEHSSNNTKERVVQAANMALQDDDSKQQQQEQQQQSAAAATTTTKRFAERYSEPVVKPADGKTHQKFSSSAKVRLSKRGHSLSHLQERKRGRDRVGKRLGSHDERRRVGRIIGGDDHHRDNKISSRQQQQQQHKQVDRNIDGTAVYPLASSDSMGSSSTDLCGGGSGVVITPSTSFTITTATKSNNKKKRSITAAFHGRHSVDDAGGAASNKVRSRRVAGGGGGGSAAAVGTSDLAEKNGRQTGVERTRSDNRDDGGGGITGVDRIGKRLQTDMNGAPLSSSSVTGFTRSHTTGTVSDSMRRQQQQQQDDHHHGRQNNVGATTNTATATTASSSSTMAAGAAAAAATTVVAVVVPSTSGADAVSVMSALTNESDDDNNNNNNDHTHGHNHHTHAHAHVSLPRNVQHVSGFHHHQDEMQQHHHHIVVGGGPLHHQQQEHHQLQQQQHEAAAAGTMTTQQNVQPLQQSASKNGPPDTERTRSMAGLRSRSVSEAAAVHRRMSLVNNTKEKVMSVWERLKSSSKNRRRAGAVSNAVAAIGEQHQQQQQQQQYESVRQQQQGDGVVVGEQRRLLLLQQQQQDERGRRTEGVAGKVTGGRKRSGMGGFVQTLSLPHSIGGEGTGNNINNNNNNLTTSMTMTTSSSSTVMMTMAQQQQHQYQQHQYAASMVDGNTNMMTGGLGGGGQPSGGGYGHSRSSSTTRKSHERHHRKSHERHHFVKQQHHHHNNANRNVRTPWLRFLSGENQ